MINENNFNMSGSKQASGEETSWKGVQLPRVMRTMHLRNKSALGTGDVHFAALTSIAKSIRDNDPSLTCGLMLPKLAKEPQQPEDLEYQAVHNVLADSRRKYDALNKQLKLKQQLVAHLTKTKTDLAKDYAHLNAVKSNAESDLNSLSAQYEAQSVASTEAAYYRKSMLHLIDRMKEDALMVKDRIRVAKDNYLALTREQERVLRQHVSIEEMSNNSLKVSARLREQLQGEDRERSTHLHSVEDAFNLQVAVKDNLLDRANESKEAAEEAMQAKPPEELDWLKVYHTHRLVARMLSDKMEREMAKFGVVQHAFKVIKTSTGVANVHTLVSKFLSKEQVYGDLLGRIAQNQKKMQSLKNEREELIKQRKDLKDQNIELKNRSNFKRGNTTKQSTGEPDALWELQKELSKIIERQSDMQLLKTHLSHWLQQSIRKFSKIGVNLKPLLPTSSSNPSLTEVSVTQSSEMKSIQPQISVGDLTSVFEALLKTLSTQIDRFAEQGEQWGCNAMETQESEGDELLLSQSLQRLRMASEEEEETVNQYDQNQQINSWRVELLRQNDKFMREIRKKAQASRKALIQSEPKKKEVVVVAVAKQEQV